MKVYEIYISGKTRIIRDRYLKGHVLCDILLDTVGRKRSNYPLRWWYCRENRPNARTILPDHEVDLETVHDDFMLI